MINIDNITQVLKKDEINGGYKICIAENKDFVYISFNGLLPPDGMQGFLDNYELMKSEVIVSETTLILDGKNLLVLPPSKDKQLFKLFIDYTNFKKIYIINPPIMTKNQLIRIFRTNKILSSYEFVSDINECKIV